MRQTKTFRVVMLPTEKESNLWLQPNNLLRFANSLKEVGIAKPQHLYILSDEEIKEIEGSKKIVSTTDKSLTNCSVCGISNDNHKMSCKTPSLRTNLPAIPESFIQAYIEAYNKGKPITEVDLEVINFVKAHTCENIKDCNETCESKKISSTRMKTRPDNTVIVRESKLYNFEDLCSLTTFIRENNYKWEGKGIINTEIIELWKKNGSQ